ncbi:MAG TPA: hypothetical protein VEU06_03700 [Micropepsaceae bacterium]|nr:hypothetical protein [Micropepsaceae bacterium]
MSNAAFKLDADKTKQLKLEQLLAMSNRIGNAIASDIAALEHGKFDALATTDPEIEKLCALYGREVIALKASGGLKGAPTPLLAALKESGARLNALLKRHGLLVGAMRNAAEGIVHAVAEEVEKTRAAKAPYSAKPKAPHGTSGAIVYNRVV